MDATYDCGCGDEAVTTRSEGNGTDGPTRVTLVGGANVGSEHEVPGMRGELGDDVKEKLYEAV